MLIQEAKSIVSLQVDTLISLEQAGIPGGAYAMREIDENHIQDLMRSDMEAWEPIKVTRIEQGTVIIGGYHRRKVAKMRGSSTIKAIYESYENENEIIEACFRDNLTHGLKASPETKSDYAYWLSLTYPQMEQKEIAIRAQISQAMVSKAIAKREAAIRDEALEELGVKDEYNTEELCKKFSKRTVKFYSEIASMDESELIKAIKSVVKPGDKEKLVRVGEILLKIGQL